MATKRSNSVIGDYHGTIGTVVISEWNGIGTMRSKQSTLKKKIASALQAQNNTIFSLIIKHLRSANNVINLGYQMPNPAKMTRSNAAASYHLREAVFGDPNDPHLNLSKVKLSRPIWKTQQAWNAVLTAEEGCIVTVKWELSPRPHKCTHLDDKVVLAFYNKNRKRFYCYENAGLRSDQFFSTDFHETFAGHELYCYMFLVSADGKLVSETEYLGLATLLPKIPEKKEA